MLDANEAAFLQSIAQEGEGNTGRLAFADWLEERDDTPRAEFVRVQCELAVAKATKQRRQALLVRERDLLNAHRRQWCEAFELPIEEAHFERGLISRMRLSQWQSGKMLESTYAPRFATLTELDLSGLQLGDAGLTAFAGRVRLPLLQKLILSENGITDTGATALGKATCLPRLNTVYLFQNPIGDSARASLERSTHFRLTNLDVGERADGYCMSPGEAEMARHQYLRTELLPVVTRYFNTYERLQSAMLCVAQYWDDEADDAVHGQLIVSELFEPVLEGVNEYGEESAADANLPTTRIKAQYGEGSSSMVGLWEAGANWDDNYGAIPLWAAFAPEGGNQNADLSENYTPAVMFYRHGEYVILPMGRPQLNGLWGGE
jgi:uncharacterized protein (TIGR02996 family)